MNNLIIPPSPSWYLNSIISCNDSGTIAYGARHEIVILKTGGRFNPHNFDYSFIPLAHKDRISSVCFAPSNAAECYQNCLVSSSDDGTVRLWNVDTKELKMINCGHQEGKKVIAVEWSKADPNKVVSVCEEGMLITWDLPSNKWRKHSLGAKIYPMCLSVCPLNKWLVAVGAKKGLILICSTKGVGNVIHKVRIHDSDVVSLSWCPVPWSTSQTNGMFPSNSKSSVLNGITKNEKSKSTDSGSSSEVESTECLLVKSNDDKNTREIENLDDYLYLASAAKDRSIYIWKAITGRYELFFNVPEKQMSTGYRSKMVVQDEKIGGEKLGHWGCVHWAEPNTIICTSLFGELISVDLQGIMKEKKNVNKKTNIAKHMKCLHGNHTKGVFSIASAISKSNQDQIIWTTALDKRLVACSLHTGKVVSEIVTIGGIIYCLSVSPLDPNRVAIGVGDGKVLVWNMGCNTHIDITIRWQKIKSKVMTLEWHPTEEGLLAFGTGEGRVGLLDLNSNKPPIIFFQTHHKSIYRLTWAPHVIANEHAKQAPTGRYALALFSVGGGEVLQYSLDTPEREPVKLFAKFDESSGTKVGRTEFIFKQDRSILAVGKEDGTIHIMDGKTIELKQVVYAHKKLVQCLSWHPTSVTSEADKISPYQNWLASASDNIQVFNINLDDFSNDPVATFSLHTEKVVDISWSPHFHGHLVSVSYDYTAQVWDVTNKSPLVNFSNHHNAVLCAVWSPVNPDYIISGSADNSLRVWKVSDQGHKRPTEKKKHRLNNIIKKFENALEATTDQTCTSPQPAPKPTVSKKTIEANKSQEMEAIKEWEASQTKKVKTRSMFPVTSSSLSVGKHLDELLRRWESKKSEGVEVNGNSSKCELVPASKEDFTYLDFFSDGKAMRKLLKLEEDQLMHMSHYAQVYQNALWRGDITQLIQEAINKRTLTDMLVAYAPMSSMRMWQEACTVYSEQLTMQGDYMKASSYLLAVHKVEEAIQLLADHKFYREAVALAKCRLPEGDPLIKALMVDYGKQAANNGMMNLAAHCFLSADDPLAASNVLARCKDLKSLRLAALLAREGGSMDLANSLAKDAFCKSLMAGDYHVCFEIFEENPDLEYFKLWAKISQIFSEKAKPDFNALLNWVQGKGIETDSIIDVISKEVKQFNICYDKLKSNLSIFNGLDTDKQLWFFVSTHLLLSCAAESNVVALEHIIQTLGGTYQFQLLNGNKNYLIHICSLLSPQGPLTESSIFTKKFSTKEEQLLLSSVHSYLLAGTMNWIVGNLNEVKDNIAKTSTDSKKLSDRFSWLSRIIQSCHMDLFNISNINYFKNEVMIKKLEMKIASRICIETNEKQDVKEKSKPRKKSLQKNSDKSKSKTLNKSVDCENNQAQKKDCDNSKITEATVSDVDIKVVKSTANSHEDASNAELIGKKSNIDSKIVNKKELKGIELDSEKEKSASEQSEVEEINNEKTDEDDVGSLKELKEAKSKYEIERISVPNPFITYSEINSVLDGLLKENDVEAFDALKLSVDESWKTATKN